MSKGQVGPLFTAFTYVVISGKERTGKTTCRKAIVEALDQAGIATKTIDIDDLVIAHAKTVYRVPPPFWEPENSERRVKLPPFNEMSMRNVVLSHYIQAQLATPGFWTARLRLALNALMNAPDCPRVVIVENVRLIEELLFLRNAPEPRFLIRLKPYPSWRPTELMRETLLECDLDKEDAVFDLVINQQDDFYPGVGLGRHIVRQLTS